MGIVFRQSIKATLVIFLGTAIGALCNLAYPYVLTAQQNGFLGNLVSYGAIIQFVILLGLPPTIQTWWQRLSAAGNGKVNVLLTIGLLLPLAVTALLLLPYGLLRTEIIHIYRPQDQALIAQYFWFLPLLIFIWTYISILDAVLVAQYKTAVASFMREVVLRGGTLATLVLFYLQVLSFSGLVWAMLLVYFLPIAGMYMAARRLPGFGLSARWQQVSVAEYSALAHFSWYHLLTGASSIMLGFLDTIMLGILDKNGLAAVALYRWPLYLAVLIKIPYRAMIVASFPALNNAYLQGDMPGLASLFRRTGVNILIAAVGMVALIGCNLHNVAALLPPAYAAVLPSLTLILMGGHLVDMATGVNNEVMSISAHYKWNFRISALLVLLLIVLNWMLIPRYGVYGAAWSIAVSLAVYNVLKAIFLYKKMGLQPFSAGTPRVLLAGALAAAAGYALPRLSVAPASGPVAARLLWILADTTLRSALIVAVYFAALLWLRPSPDLSGYLRSIRKNKRLF